MLRTLRFLSLFLLCVYAHAQAWEWPWAKDKSSTVPSQTGIQLNTQVEGLSDKPLENVQTRLQTNIHSLPPPIDQNTAFSFYQQSDTTVASGISPYGYFAPHIDKDVEVKSPDHWLLKYQVQPGPVSVITVIDLHLVGQGASEPSLQQLLAKPPFQLQQAFLSEPYENFKQSLIDEANKLGYINAAFSDHRVLVNEDNHQVEIHLTLDTGSSYGFGPISFQKNPLSDGFLQRFVPFKTGSRYTPGLSNQLQTNLGNSGYFQQADVIPQLQTITPQGEIPIHVNLTPKPRQQYTLGAGYGTDTGPRVSLGTNWNYVTDTGHQLSLMTRLSQVQNTMTSKYTIPGTNPLEDQYNLNASLSTNNISQGNSQVRQVGAGFRHIHDGWQRNINLSYQIERYSFSSDPYQTSHLLLPSLSFQKTVSDDPLFPTRGNSFNFMIQGAKEGLAADTNLFQARLQEKWLFPVTVQSQILLRTDLGYTAIHDQSLLPLSLSYFAGGAQSVRGYGYNSLGPGRYLVAGSAEYRHKITGDWYGATFMDVGNAFDNVPSGGEGGLQSKLGAIYNQLQRGVGVGIGWNSPVGPMQLSIAKAVNADGQPNRIQFNMGASL